MIAPARSIHIEIPDINSPEANAYVILAKTLQALREANWPEWRIHAFLADATSADYEHLLDVVRALGDADA